MPETTVRWIKDKTFLGSDANGHSVVLSGDDPPEGVRPSQMLLVALGACSAYDVVDIMLKKRKPLSMLEVIVKGDQEKDPPWAYKKIHIKYILKGEDITDKAIAKAIEL